MAAWMWYVSLSWRYKASGMQVWGHHILVLRGYSHSPSCRFNGRHFVFLPYRPGLRKCLRALLQSCHVMSCGFFCQGQCSHDFRLWFPPFHASVCIWLPVLEAISEIYYTWRYSWHVFRVFISFWEYPASWNRSIMAWSSDLCGCGLDMNNIGHEIMIYLIRGLIGMFYIVLVGAGVTVQPWE